jgi:chemotaxis protein methyltransferase CheR
MARAALDAMMTHESFFFRDTRPFDEFRKVILPSLLESRATSRRIRIWCAAASTGQEPYSLAMILREEAAKLAGWTVEIVGTDIAPAALNYAKAGLYTQFEVQRGLPIQLLVKYFTKDGDSWRVNQPLRDMVRYSEFNLLGDARTLGVFDVVFCRNVLIYFDQETKSQVLGRLAGQMSKDGYLFLGGAETVIGLTSHFLPVPGQRGIYAPSHAQPALRAQA